MLWIYMVFAALFGVVLTGGMAWWAELWLVEKKGKQTILVLVVLVLLITGFVVLYGDKLGRLRQTYCTGVVLVAICASSKPWSNFFRRRRARRLAARLTSPTRRRIPDPR
jgi:hypothetical protein